MSRLQNEDFKSSAQLIAAGGSASQLLNDSKIWITANSINSTLNSAITSGLIGGGGGAKNYITQGSTFENNATTGWSLSSTTLDSNKFPNQVAGSWTAASGSLALAIVGSGSQLAGSYSASLTSSAASTAGNMMVSDAITLDQEAQGAVLAISFFYKVSSGAANLNFSGTSSNSIGVGIYDVTNSAWIQPSGVFNLVNKSTTQRYTGTFQVPINTTSIRLALYFPNASAGIFGITLDDFVVGPQVTAVAPAMSDFDKSYTPTITGSVSNPTQGAGATSVVRYRRIGDSLEIDFYYKQTAAGTAGSGIYFISLPSGLSIDTSKLPVTNDYVLVGTGALFNNTNRSNLYVAVQPQTNTTTFSIIGGVYNGGEGDWGSTYFALNNTTLYVRAFAVIPISGWSSNTISSADTDTRVITASVNNPSATITTSPSVITWGTVLEDTSGSFSGSTYTVPVSGRYQVSGNILVGTGTASGGGANTKVRLYKNGVDTNRISTNYIVGQSGYQDIPVAFGVINCNAGDTLQIYIESNATTPSVSGLSTQNFISFSRLSGPAVVQATESVNAAYSSTNGPTINNTTPTVTYATKLYDSHNAYSGGTYSIPVSGKFLISGQFRTASVAQTANFAIFMYLYKNGALAGTIAVNRTTVSITTNVEASGCIQVSCNAGDQLTIRFYSDASTTLDTLANYNQFQIVRVGN